MTIALALMAKARIASFQDYVILLHLGSRKRDPSHRILALYDESGTWPFFEYLQS
jgi:hypothetical protein